MIRLVFFDIDGTIIYHTKSYGSIRKNRYAYGIKKAWDIDIPIEMPKYEGWIDRGLTWQLVSKYGVSREQFLKKLPIFRIAMREYLENASHSGQLFVAIPEAKALLTHLTKFPHMKPALLTGNMEPTAWWKLDVTGLKEYFEFGIFGDLADDKVDIANKAIDKASHYFKTNFSQSEVVVIGDTPFDIECGKAMGVTTVIVSTGKHNVSDGKFKKSGVDLVVGSLMDDDLLNLLGIS